MYKCENGHIFDEPDIRRDDVGGFETGVGYMPYYESFAVCPNCGTENFHEIKTRQCDLCCDDYDEDDIYEVARLHVCIDCIEELKLFLEEMDGDCNVV